MKITFLLISFTAIITLCAQSKNSVTASIPFQLTKYNNISIQSIFNEKDTVQLMFHLAVGGVSTTAKASQKLASIHWGINDSVESWGGKSESQMSSNNLLQIGALRWDSVFITQSIHSGHETDGKFGPNLFNSKFIEIHFDNKVINLYQKLPPDYNNSNSIPLIVENGNYFIQAEITVNGKQITNRYLLHSGYSSSILFDDAFTADNQLNRKLPLLSESELKDSFGNVLKTKRSKLDRFLFGNFSFTEMPVASFEGSIARQKISVLGMDILKRFNLTIDTEKNKLYLVKSRLYSEDFHE